MIRWTVTPAVLSLLWLAAVASAAPPSKSAWLGYRNDSNVVLVIQTACLAREQPRWGKPQRLYPGEVAWESISGPDKQLLCSIYQAGQLDRPIHQQAIAFEGKDLFFSILTEQPPGVAKGEKPPLKARLVLARPPSRAPTYTATTNPRR